MPSEFKPSKWEGGKIDPVQYFPYMQVTTKYFTNILQISYKYVTNLFKHLKYILQYFTNILPISFKYRSKILQYFRRRKKSYIVKIFHKWFTNIFKYQIFPGLPGSSCILDWWECSLSFCTNHSGSLSSRR